MGMGSMKINNSGAKDEECGQREGRRCDFKQGGHTVGTLKCLFRLFLDTTNWRNSLGTLNCLFGLVVRPSCWAFKHITGVEANTGTWKKPTRLLEQRNPSVGRGMAQRRIRYRCWLPGTHSPVGCPQQGHQPLCKVQRIPCNNERLFACF